MGTDAISRTSQSVSIFLPCVDAWIGNQSIHRATAMPIAEAITPIRSICLTAARPSRADGSSALMALLAHGRGILRERSDRGAGGRQAAARVSSCVWVIVLGPAVARKSDGATPRW